MCCAYHPPHIPPRRHQPCIHPARLGRRMRGVGRRRMHPAHSQIPDAGVPDPHQGLDLEKLNQALEKLDLGSIDLPGEVVTRASGADAGRRRLTVEVSRHAR